MRLTSLMNSSQNSLKRSAVIRRVLSASQGCWRPTVYAETELAKIKKRQRQIVDAIADGISARTLKDELVALEAREDLLMAKLQTPPQQNVLLNPNMADLSPASGGSAPGTR